MSGLTPADVERIFDVHITSDYEDATFDRIDEHYARAMVDERAILLLEAFRTINSAAYNGRRVDTGGLALDLLARIDATPRPGTLGARVAAAEAAADTLDLTDPHADEIADAKAGHLG